MLVLWGCGQVDEAPQKDMAATAYRSPEVSYSEHNDTSPPLFLIQPAERRAAFEDHPVKRLPKLPGLTAGASAESVLQPARSVPSPLAPTAGLSFDGVGVGLGSYADCCAPPDTNGDVGLNHFVETVNLDYAVFNKTTGALVFGPVAINTLWSGFGGSCQTHNDGDPIVIYDSKADRWVVSQFAVNVNPSLECVAVSQTSDPTGAYYRYAFSYGADFPDYPKMGVWSDAYYTTFNMFNGAGTAFLGAKVCAYDRSKMLTGAAATQQCFNTSNLYGGLLPADLDGANLPPAGAPNYIVGLDAPVASNLLQYWKFHVDWTTPANSTFTGPIALTVASYTTSCNTLARGDCIPQGGGGTNLESLADRAMYRLAYRNFGDHQALVFNHTIQVGSGSTLHSGVRWYELRADASNNLSVFQQGTYSPDSNWRWMGSAAQDKSGNMALGYSVSSSSISPQIHFTGRLAADAAGTMTQGENIVINGGGSQTGGLARWGDYSMMGIDPVDDCTFWYTQEYLKASGSFNWSTRINSFKLPNCGGPPPAPDFSLSTSPTSQTVTQGVGTSYTETITPINGFTGSVTLSVSGLPTGASGTFSPNPATSTSTLSVTTASTTPTGSFPLTITGVSGTLTHTSSATLVVNPAAAPDFSLSATPASQTVTQGTAGSYTVNVTRTGGFTGSVTLSMSSSPAGLTGTFSPNPNTGASSSLSVPTSTSTTPGTYTLTITGTGTGVPTHTTTVTLVVNAPAAGDFSLAVTPASVTAKAGTPANYTVNITRTGGFSGGVTFSLTGAPTGSTVVFNPNPATGASSALTVTTPASTAAATWTLTVRGVSGTLSHTATATLNQTAGCVNGNGDC
jgi:hypothetical protein